MATGDALSLLGYKLTFGDEFNTFSSNGPSNYQIRTNTGTWDTTVGVDPFSIKSGVLHITAAPSPDPSKTGGQPYTSGVITTNHSFNQIYGYFEMRAELPAGAGMFPAFWMLPQKHMWPPELDLLETFGTDNGRGEGGANSFHHGLVSSEGGSGSWTDTGGANLQTQFNTFGVDWQKDTITYFFNGKEVSQVATPADFHQPMFLLANLAVGGSWAGPPAGQTADLKIDYIRAFSKDEANPAVMQESISAPDGGGRNFYGATDAAGKGPGGTAAPAASVPVPAPTPMSAALTQTSVPTSVTLGTGSDVMSVTVSENAWEDDTQSTIRVDGQTIGIEGTSDVKAKVSLFLAEDAYQGDANYVVTLDGKQVGPVATVTASNRMGQAQEVVLDQAIAAGYHDIGVTFLNDAWAGTVDTDRNLFVKGIEVNGARMPGMSADLLSAGTVHFGLIIPVA